MHNLQLAQTGSFWAVYKTSILCMYVRMILSCIYVSGDNCFHLQPICSTKLRSILITPDNVRYLANYISSSATIDSRSIRFSSGTTSEKLLEVPFADAGELDAHVSVQITVGYKPPTADSDPSFGISDGTNLNRYYIIDSGNYGSHAPCHITSSEGTGENERVTSRTVPPQFTFLFSPFHKYGACSSSQDGGYLNVGTFNKQVDPTRGLSFQIYRQHAAEQYQFYHVLIEIL